jgi:hypothetical protein
MGKDVEEEIERLKSKKVELVNRINLVTSFDDKEEIENEVKRIQKQIDMLERMN